LSVVFACVPAVSKHTALVICERRQKLWTLQAKGMKIYEIAKELIMDSEIVT